MNILEYQDYYDTARIIILLLAGIPFLIEIVLVPIVYFKIVKPLDELFRGKGLTFEEGLWHFSLGMRMGQYTLCIVFPERSKKHPYAKMIYQGYDFRGNASKEQVILSYAFLICFIIILIFAFVLILYDFVIRPSLI
jgi:hypothetical protein